jgi:hypothetical protein
MGYKYKYLLQLPAGNIEKRQKIDEFLNRQGSKKLNVIKKIGQS